MINRHCVIFACIWIVFGNEQLGPWGPPAVRLAGPGMALPAPLVPAGAAHAGRLQRSRKGVAGGGKRGRLVGT